MKGIPKMAAKAKVRKIVLPPAPKPTYECGGSSPVMHDHCTRKLTVPKRKRRRATSNERPDIQEIRKEYLAGEPTAVIAKRHGCGRQTVYYSTKDLRERRKDAGAMYRRQ